MESEGAQISEGQDPGRQGQGPQGLARGKEAVQRAFQALQKSSEPLQGFGEALAAFALIWAWFKSWFAIASNGYKIYQLWPTPDVSHLAPQVVLVVGLVVTNVLGFLNFWHQGLHREAILAAVDLDSPYFAYGHMINALRGEANPEFQKVCLRNSIWRSLPLAMLTCALTSRLLIEVPLCQVTASGSAIAVGLWPEDQNKSMWVSSLPRDHDEHAQPFAAEWAEYYEDFAHEVEHKKLKSRDSKELEKRMLAVEKKLWTAAHCNASTWTLTKRPLKQERMEDQVGAAGDETDEKKAGDGLSNLVPLNVVLFEEAKQEAVKREETLKPAVITLINKLAKEEEAESVGFAGTLALQASDWNWLLDQAIGFLKKALRTDHVETFESSRPWTLKLGSFKTLNLGEWEMPLGQAFALLLVAVLPVRKKILSFGEASSISKVLVTLYTSLDMCALVMTWLLCAVAPLAKRFGNGISEFITNIWPELEQFLVGYGLDEGSNVMFDIMKETSPKLLDMLEGIEPALAWDSKFFLQLTLGSLGFLSASAALAYWVSPGLPVSTCASIGVCGPLWIFTEKTDNRGTKAFTLVLCRCLLLLAMVGFSWWPASEFSVKLFSAWTVKKIIDKESFMYYWLPFLFVTLLLGLAGASSLSGEESSDSSDGESEDPKDVKSSASSDYGTFSSSESIP